ncbi:uncharacterized protein LOC118200444 [Stegodyphus dumicola]|uniref:uncharacterized protein LOC118200444 n=1 Tax=Stegodyphus dumicola TaxID=202533 RepID=UPI0015B0DF55|nr:uncharacterized protein LOC118200444 [Stegodyphus dumicola]
MMAVAHCSSRKRPRSCEDDSCELMPISKRINDLHIRSCFPESSSSIDDCMPEMHPRVRASREIVSGNYNISASEAHRPQVYKDSVLQPSYRPELSVAENPYYYHVNEMLYEAHIQRLQRLAKI